MHKESLLEPSQYSVWLLSNKYLKNKRSLSVQLHRSWQSHSVPVGAFAKSYQGNPTNKDILPCYFKERKIEENIFKLGELRMKTFLKQYVGVQKMLNHKW